MRYPRRFMRCLAGLTCVALSAKANEKAAVPSLAMEPAAAYSWWHSGEPVIFRPVEGVIPQELSEVEGRISDVGGELLDTVSVSREELASTGWVWKPAGNGFYEVAFSWLDEAGNRHEVIQAYWRQVPNGNRSRFELNKFSVAVTHSFTSEIPTVGQFGFDGQTTAHIPMAKLVGFDLARLTLGWGSVFVRQDRGVESVKGVRNWELYDKDIEILAANGIEIMAQITYTPLWASPQPDKTNVSVCVIDGTAYAPVNMEDFSSFVEAAVTRYQDKIKIWEIWNEPAMPGGSIFWRDTPENYVRLLKAGYEAVKRVDPEAEVWNGGMGMRIAYYSFYDTILKLGAGDYFDKLSLHGKFVDLKDYHEIDIENAIPHKPAVVTEWHAILSGQGTTADMDTESNLSMRMMRELFSQIKQGVLKSTLFSMANQTETEAIPFALANQYTTHSAGLFRRQPRYEPRHPAVVMATFLRLVERKATFVKEIRIGEEGIGMLFNTNAGTLLVVLIDQEPVAVSDLDPFRTDDSMLVDWEGKEIDRESRTVLDLYKVYYLTAPNEAAVARAENTDRLLPPQREVKESFTAPEAAFVRGALPEEDRDQHPAWIKENWQYQALMPEAVDAAGFSAQALVGVTKSGVDLLVSVQDEVHVQNETKSWWNGDSLQFAVDCEGRGMLGGHVEFVAALNADGVVFRKLTGVNTGADLPIDVSPADGPLQSGNCTITREGETTTYRIHLPWNELYPMVYDPNRKLKLSLLVNNNNGQGRGGYLEWGSGIGSQKDPSKYGILNPARGK